MVNIVVGSWCKAENMRRAELLAQKMDEERVIYIKPDQFEGTESEKCFQFPAPNHETYEILTDGWQRCGLCDEVGELRKIFKAGDAATAKALAGSRGAVEAASSLLHPPRPTSPSPGLHVHSVPTSSIDIPGGFFCMFRSRSMYPGR